MTDLFLHKENRETLIKKIISNTVVIDEEFFKKQLLTRKSKNIPSALNKELDYILEVFPKESIELFDKYDDQIRKIYDKFFTKEGNYKKSLRYKMGQVGWYDKYWDLDDDEHSRAIAKDLERR